ncbi:TPA: PRD domain-containing protein [Clostridium sporogenes]
MKVIKKINNNVAICLDKDDRELIAFGKGIGFPKVPYELNNLSLITRTFYGVEYRYFDLFKQIDERVFEVCAKIIDVGRSKIKNTFSSNILFTLADHINFALERTKKNIVIKSPIFYDIENLYEIEVEVGKISLDLIKKELGVQLPKEEAYSIALHFINSEKELGNTGINGKNSLIIEDVILIVERCQNISIKRYGFNYSRFNTHMEYLLKRRKKDINVSSENKNIFFAMKEQYLDIYKCVNEINKYFINTLNWDLNEEELLYLMLHINRICSRENY